ncbi:hypothetical protein ONE63_008871 [Megalurothrips usitatus]|uniref:Uncharacterized protein n=1 Tax=Megalurothrips usitatus TaxID=439358 RepID=A0AAV7XLZ1_9NEOP|nr:hypothetical protein ONE63_008871 [Megalurothrips usitatus]
MYRQLGVSTNVVVHIYVGVVYELIIGLTRPVSAITELSPYRHETKRLPAGTPSKTRHEGLPTRYATLSLRPGPALRSVCEWKGDGQRRVLCGRRGVTQCSQSVYAFQSSHSPVKVQPISSRTRRAATVPGAHGQRAPELGSRVVSESDQRAVGGVFLSVQLRRCV